MIQKYSAGNGANLSLAQQQGRKSQMVLGVFVGGVVFLALGAGVSYKVLGVPVDQPPSTSQLIAALAEPKQEPTSLVASERRGLRYQPGATASATAPAAPTVIAAAQPPAPTPAPTPAPMEISQPDLESLVTRAIGSVASAPLDLRPGDLAADVSDVAMSLTAQQAPVRVTVPVAVPTPEPSPVAAQPSTPIDPAQLFTASTAQAANTCVADLRNLAQGLRVYFPSGGVNADEQGIVQARLIGFVARECPGVTIQVEGHSDASGDPSANLRLSEERARHVITRLTASGVDTSMFSAVGYGDQRPSGLEGPQPASYYDRRVEFSVIETGLTAPTYQAANSFAGPSACLLQLEQAVVGTHVTFAPRSIMAPQSDLGAVYQLAAAVDACPEARLRIVGQFSDDPGLGETPATGRMRAIALMSTLVGAGFDSEGLIVAAHSEPKPQTGMSERRIDFEVIRNEF